jgi:hypothetical protein
MSTAILFDSGLIFDEVNMKLFIGCCCLLISLITYASDNMARANYSIEVNNDFCTCSNGESKIVNRCELFCAYAPISPKPTLYLNANLARINNDESLQVNSLYDWCNTKFDDEVTTPLCILSAVDEENHEIIMSVSIFHSKNILYTDVLPLIPNHTYSIRLIESGSRIGSNNVSYLKIK